MDNLIRTLNGQLEKADDPTDQLIAQINSLNPPKQLTADDVYVRRCRLAGDALDLQYGRFRTEDMPKLLKLVNGAPLLVGHRKDTVGIGRFFGGKTQKLGEVSYVSPYFYWLKEHSSAEDLRVNIDGGIYNEASLGFMFGSPTCSICGLDVRRCEHLPGEEYDGDLCHIWYDDVKRITEGSIVYRGAEPGTGFETIDDTLSVALSEKRKINQTIKNKELDSRLRGNDRQTEDQAMDGKIEMTADQWTKLMAVLGLDGEPTGQQLLDNVADLIADGKIGVDALKERRERVQELAIHAMALSDKDLSDTSKTRIEQADWGLLTELEDMYQERFDAATPTFRCPHCHEVITGLRQSIPEENDQNDGDPVYGRRLGTIINSGEQQ
ncbi:MAG: hypothetical protein P9M15_00925 [Candidatus Electryoneaceae bacterium]|nr:hypothetical protein [Candidatus Electryoneaceae bacterium]